MHDVTPDPKIKARGAKRYRRRVASPKQWAAIRAEKLEQNECRLCRAAAMAEELHHLVPRSLGGDDVADNLVGLCRACHSDVELWLGTARPLLAESLTDSEYAYIVEKLGEGAVGRLFGV